MALLFLFKLAIDSKINFNYENWDTNKIREHAYKFDARNFKTSIKKYVEDRYEEFKHGLNQTSLLSS